LTGGCCSEVALCGRYSEVVVNSGLTVLLFLVKLEGGPNKFEGFVILTTDAAAAPGQLCKTGFDNVAVSFFYYTVGFLYQV
jgi:hypothetical protein